MSISIKTNEEGYTYADYLKLDDGKRREVIDGVIYLMSGPSKKHQGVQKTLSKILDIYLAGHKCQVFNAPFDVRLDPCSENKDKIIVQPDVMVICDEKKLENGKRCDGAPEVVFEILSEGGQQNDLIKKKKLYKKYGVKEYFVISPENEAVIGYKFLEGLEEIEYERLDDIIYIKEIDFKIRVSDIFGYTERIKSVVFEEL